MRRPATAKQTIGGNFPPDPIDPDPFSELHSTRLLNMPAVAALPQLLARDFPELPQGRDHLLKKLTACEAADGSVEVQNEDEARRAGDLLKEARDFCALEVEPMRVSVKRPVDGVASAIQAWFVSGIAEPVLSGVKPLTVALKSYLDKKNAAVLAEDLRLAEAKRAKAEQLADLGLFDDSIAAETDADKLQRAAETKKSTERTRVRGDMGSVTSLKSRWAWTVENKMDLVQAIASGQASVEWVKLDEDYAKLQINKKEVRKVPGLHIYQETKL